MGLLSNLVSGAIGYGISEASKSHTLRDMIDSKLKPESQSFQKKTLRDIITEYAQERGIYTTNNDLAYELHLIAMSYEGYDYDRLH